MSIPKTPTFNSTLVSGELCKAWTEHTVMESVEQQNPDLFKMISGVELNNKGKIIEFLIECPLARSNLLSNGLTFGSETVMFRPYNGVFALLKNVPLEVNKDGVLQLTKLLNWHIDGPSPTSRIAPQYNILRDGRAILSGRWTCMLDRFPAIPTAADGTKTFFIKAYGGRKISFSISFTRFPKEKVLMQDPNNYTVQPSAFPSTMSSNHQQQTENTTGEASQGPKIQKDKTPEKTKATGHLTTPAPKNTETPTKEQAASKSPPSSSESSSSSPVQKKKLKKKKKISSKEPEEKVSLSSPSNKNNKHPSVTSKSQVKPPHPGKPPTPPSMPDPFEFISECEFSDDEPVTLQDFPSYSTKIQVYGFTDSTKLLDNLNIKHLYEPSNYPKPEFTRFKNSKTDTAFIHLPKEVANDLLLKSGLEFNGEKLRIARHTHKNIKHHLVGLTIKHLPLDITYDDIIQALHFRYERSDFNKMTYLTLQYNEELQSNTFAYQVPFQQFEWLAKTLTINGESYSVSVAHASPKPHYCQQTKKAKEKTVKMIPVKNSFNLLSSDKSDEATDVHIVQCDASPKDPETNSHHDENHDINMDIDHSLPEATDHSSSPPQSQINLVINNNTINLINSPNNHTDPEVSPSNGNEEYPYTDWSLFGQDMLEAAVADSDNAQLENLDWTKHLQDEAEAMEVGSNLTDNTQEETSPSSIVLTSPPGNPNPVIASQPTNQPRVHFVNHSLLNQQVDKAEQKTENLCLALVPYSQSSQEKQNIDERLAIVDTTKLLEYNWDTYCPQQHPSQNETVSILPSLLNPENSSNEISQHTASHEKQSHTTDNATTSSQSLPSSLQPTSLNNQNKDSLSPTQKEDNTTLPSLQINLTPSPIAEDPGNTLPQTVPLQEESPPASATANNISDKSEATNSQFATKPLHDETSSHSSNAKKNDFDLNENSDPANTSPPLIENDSDALIIDDSFLSNDTEDNDSLSPDTLNDDLIHLEEQEDQTISLEPTRPPALPHTKSQDEKWNHWYTPSVRTAPPSATLMCSPVDITTQPNLETNEQTEESEHIEPEVVRLKRDHSHYSTDDEGKVDAKKSKSLTTTSNPTNISSSSSHAPTLEAPPKPQLSIPEFVTHGFHQFPIREDSVQKCHTIFNNHDPVATETILNMIVSSNFNFPSLVNNPDHSTECLQREKCDVTSTLLYLLVGQNDDLISSWPTTLPPLPADVTTKWKKLCKNNLPKHHEWINHLVSDIKKVTLKAVLPEEVDITVRQTKRNIKEKSVKSASR